MSNDSGGADRRAYFRIDTSLPVRHEKLVPSELEAVTSEIATCVREESDTWSDMTVQLARLEQKLDNILMLLNPEGPRPLGDWDRKLVQLSGSGICYSSPDALPVGGAARQVPERVLALSGQLERHGAARVRIAPAEQHDFYG